MRRLRPFVGPKQFLEIFKKRDQYDDGRTCKTQKEHPNNYINENCTQSVHVPEYPLQTVFKA